MFTKLFFTHRFILALALAACGPTPHAHASAIAWIDKAAQKFIVKSDFFFYGDLATPELVKRSVDEIRAMWNEPRVLYISQGKEYPIEFQLSFNIENQPKSTQTQPSNLYRLSFPAVSTFVYHTYLSDFDENRELKINSLRYLQNHPDANIIEITAKSEYDTRSNYRCGGQHGTFVISDDLGISTTAAHEYGHGLGLGHLQGSPCLNEKAPSIMCPRGSKTAAKFQYNSKMQSGAENGGTLNPYYRKVTADDIISLRMTRIKPTVRGYKIVGPHLRDVCMKNI